jgi:DNA polymerase III epsilon subunit-like protein
MSSIRGLHARIYTLNRCYAACPNPDVFDRFSLDDLHEVYQVPGYLARCITRAGTTHCHLYPCRILRKMLESAAKTMKREL